jgi:multiple sugar transport system substrate-binding protein
MVVALLSPDLLAAGIQAASYLPIDSKTEQILTDFYNQNPDLKSLNNLADSLKPPPYWNGSRGGEVPTAARDTAIAVNRGQDPGQALSDLQAKAQDLTK